MRTQRLSTPNNNNNNTLNVNNNEISCANDTNSSTDTNPKANIPNGSSNMSNMHHSQHIGSSMSDAHSGILGDMHNPLLNGNHHLSTPSSLITPTSSAPSLSPPRFNFNHGFCSTMSPMYTPQMSISDSYRFVTKYILEKMETGLILNSMNLFNSSMPFSHAPISSMASLSANPLGLQQQHQQHKYEQHQHQQSQYHQRNDEMTSTYQCHMSRLNIPSPSLQSLHQASHPSLSALQNHHTYSSTSSSPHNAALDVPAGHPVPSVTPPSSSLAPPSSIYSYDPINLGGYGSRLSPCGSSDNYQLNGGSYSSGNGSGELYE